MLVFHGLRMLVFHGLRILAFHGLRVLVFDGLLRPRANTAPERINDKRSAPFLHRAEQGGVGILLPNNQRQHRSVHAPTDVQPAALRIVLSTEPFVDPRFWGVT